MSDESVLHLSKFTKLKGISIECPIITPSLLAKSLPKSTHTLSLARYNNLCNFTFSEKANFPNIDSIYIGGNILYPSFFSECKFDNLKKLSLQNVTLVKGSLSACSDLANLKEVDVYISKNFVERTETFEKEVEALKKKGVKVHIQSDS